MEKGGLESRELGLSSAGREGASGNLVLGTLFDPLHPATPELHLLIHVGVQEILFGLSQLQLCFCLLETQSQSSLSKSEAKLGLNQVSQPSAFLSLS